MSDDIVEQAESIARTAFGQINVEEYQALLFQIGAMLAVWRATMLSAGYTEYFVEKAAWLMLTGFYGQHIANTEVTFEPRQ